MSKSKVKGPSLFEQNVEEVSRSADAACGLVRLADFVENPDNPQTVSDQAFDRLVEKLKRVPIGLTAKRIAYVTDHPAGKFVVLSGCKRLRALKRIHGEDHSVPGEWFQDITEMSADQRREFIVTANVVEGEWIASILVSMFPKDELSRLMDDADVSAILADIPSVQKIAENEEVDQDSFADSMELKIKLTEADRDKAIAVLDEVNADDMGAAFMQLIRGGK